MYRRLAFLVTLAVLACDAVSKVAAVAFLEGQPSIQVLGKFLQLSFARNPGAAFSFGTGSTLVFTLLSLGICGALIVAIGKVQNKHWALALGGVLGGALGNVVDRLLRSPGFLRGHVVDFIEFPNYPLFNLADSAIVISAVAIAWLSFRSIPFGAEDEVKRPRVDSS